MEGGYLIHPLFPPSVVSQLRNASKSQGEGGGWLIKEDKIGRFLPSPLVPWAIDFNLQLQRKL